MAYVKRHMFCILFDVVLLASVVAGVRELSDAQVSGTSLFLIASVCTFGSNTK